MTHIPHKDGWSPATGSVSLITDGQLVVLVDTAGPANWQELEAGKGGVMCVREHTLVQHCMHAAECARRQ
jgi:hypothetical protein